MKEIIFTEILKHQAIESAAVEALEKDINMMEKSQVYKLLDDTRAKLKQLLILNDKINEPHTTRD